MRCKRPRNKRERGKGRRPDLRGIERAARRQGLADASYSQALDKLRALAPASVKRLTSPTDLLEAMQ